MTARHELDTRALLHREVANDGEKAIQVVERRTDLTRQLKAKVEGLSPHPLSVFVSPRLSRDHEAPAEDRHWYQSAYDLAALKKPPTDASSDFASR
jgi:hypothetical protein